MATPPRSGRTPRSTKATSSPVSGGYPFKMRMNGRGMKEVDAMPTVFMV